jgi:hypothetical protein
MNADEVPHRLDAGERVREVRDHHHAGNRSQRGASRIVTETHSRRSEHPIEGGKEWEEETRHEDRAERVSCRVLVECAETSVAQEKTRPKGVLKEIASQAEGERRSHKGRGPAVEKSSEGTKKHASRSDYEEFRQVEEHAENASRDEDQGTAGTVCRDPGAQCLKAHRGMETEVVMQPE